ncbi:MAG: hypothetical protein ACHQPI_12525 [Thermoanaerobaculia bacterium]
MRRTYAPPGDRLHLSARDPRLHDLAARLWEPGEERAGAIVFDLDTFDGPAPAPEAERHVAWSHGSTEFRLRMGALLDLGIDLSTARVSGRVSSALLDAAPDLAARYVLEAPSAVLLGRRNSQVLHAGAVVGPKGAVVLRGAAGAGKSTLVAALHADGFRVLADESLFVSRRDPTDLAAAVRDLTLLPDSAALLGVTPATRFAFSGGEEKRRIDLFAEGTPARRRAHLAAAVLLGGRERTPATLVPLSSEEFSLTFRDGEIPEERRTGDPDPVARAWGARGGFRLDGARDLAGAVSLLSEHLMYS